MPGTGRNVWLDAGQRAAHCHPRWLQFRRDRTALELDVLTAGHHTESVQVLRGCLQKEAQPGLLSSVPFYSFDTVKCPGNHNASVHHNECRSAAYHEADVVLLPLLVVKGLMHFTPNPMFSELASN